MGLNYVPTTRFNLFDTIKDFNRFVRLLTVKRNFFDPESKSDNDEPHVVHKSVNEFVSLNFNDQITLLTLQDLQRENNGSLASNVTADMVQYGTTNPSFYPIKSRASVLDDFQYLVEQELRNLSEEDRAMAKNLTPVQFSAIKQLRENNNLIIRQSDKEGTVVVLDKDLYSHQVMTILNQQDTYRKLQADPTLSFRTSLRDLLKDGVALGVITPKIAEYMDVEFPVTSIFHGLPKTHKNCFPPPLRPIISGIGSLCECLSEWVDAHLQPVVSLRPGYLRDSKQVLQVLYDAEWKENYSWITLDVTNLYSNILPDKAILAVEYMLHKYSNYSNELCHFLIMAIRYLLSHNFFSFDRNFFLQIVGAPMGSKFSPSLANLYMSFWEEHYLFSPNNPYRTFISTPTITISI